MSEPVSRGPEPWLTRPGIWFWSVIALGAALRLYLVVFTEGTYDVEIWQRHASDVCAHGLIGYYHADPEANHPPFISEVESLIARGAEWIGLPYRIPLRAPFALIDAATTLLVLKLLGSSRWRYLAAAGYWISPLSIIFSAYHGNTDSAVAFFLLLSIWLLARERPVWAAVAVGASLWIKLPGLLAIPALALAVPGWRKRLFFLATAGAIALSTYVPALLADAPVVYHNVFGYHGQFLQTTGGVPVWGPLRVLLLSLIAPPDRWPVGFRAPLAFLWDHEWQIALAVILLLTWLRRSRRSPMELCGTIAMIYTVVYALSDAWAFQYFAWSLPFWFFLSPWFFVPATALATAYIYSLYWLLCGNPWLLGKWDFVGHPQWPAFVLVFRDLAMVFFFGSALLFLAAAVGSQLQASWARRLTS